MDQRYTGTGGSELDGNGTGSGEKEFGTGGLRPKTDKREAAMMMMMIYIINLSVVQHEAWQFRNLKLVINLSEA